MSSIADKALEAHLSAPVNGHAGEGPDEEDDDGGDAEDASPSREALREAWAAVKGNDFDGFADAVESLIEIKLASQT